MNNTFVQITSVWGRGLHTADSIGPLLAAGRELHRLFGDRAVATPICSLDPAAANGGGALVMGLQFHDSDDTLLFKLSYDGGAK